MSTRNLANPKPFRIWETTTAELGVESVAPTHPGTSPDSVGKFHTRRDRRYVIPQEYSLTG